MNRQARYNNNSKVETHPVIGCTWFPWIYNKKRIKTKLAPPQTPHHAKRCSILRSIQISCMWKFPASAMPKLGRRSDKCPEGSSSWEFHSKGREWNWQSPSDDVSDILLSMSSSMSSILLASSTYADHTTVTGYTIDWKFFKCAVRYGCFQKIEVPQNGWFIMENPIKMDDLGVPLFSETSICTCPDTMCDRSNSRCKSTYALFIASASWLAMLTYML